jgi:hypothetical protein
LICLPCLLARGEGLPEVYCIKEEAIMKRIAINTPEGQIVTNATGMPFTKQSLGALLNAKTERGTTVKEHLRQGDTGVYIIDYALIEDITGKRSGSGVLFVDPKIVDNNIGSDEVVGVVNVSYYGDLIEEALAKEGGATNVSRPRELIERVLAGARERLTIGAAFVFVPREMLLEITEPPQIKHLPTVVAAKKERDMAELQMALGLSMTAVGVAAFFSPYGLLVSLLLAGAGGVMFVKNLQKFRKQARRKPKVDNIVAPAEKGKTARVTVQSSEGDEVLRGALGIVVLNTKEGFCVYGERADAESGSVSFVVLPNVTRAWRRVCDTNMVIYVGGRTSERGKEALNMMVQASQRFTPRLEFVYPLQASKPCYLISPVYTQD